MAELATVDIPAIEILASGGPVHAVGGPPDGDFYTREELVAIADAHHELGEEIRAPIKIGHSEIQKLAENSGLTAGEMPGLGWLDPASFRVEDDKETGVAKLVADAKAVPAKLADLMRAGAYRTRSSEIRQYASQQTQKSYDWVVGGLALLGANVPAIQTLDDVYRLYERAGLDKPDADTFVVRRDHATAEIVWQPESGFQDLSDDIEEILNPAGAAMPRFWVSDIAIDLTACVVRNYDADETWVVPITVDGQGVPTVSPASQWQPADDALVAAANELERRNSGRSRKNRRRAESRPMEITLTDEQITAVREKFGLAADAEITPEALVEAAEARANELSKRDERIAELEAGNGDDNGERIRKLEADLETEKRRSFEQRRDAKIRETMRTRELEPADVEKWHSRFETLGEEACIELLDELPRRERELEFGSDGADIVEDGLTEEQLERREHEMAEVFPGYTPREVTA